MFPISFTEAFREKLHRNIWKTHIFLKVFFKLPENRVNLKRETQNQFGTAFNRMYRTGIGQVLETVPRIPRSNFYVVVWRYVESRACQKKFVCWILTPRQMGIQTRLKWTWKKDFLARPSGKVQSFCSTDQYKNLEYDYSKMWLKNLNEPLSFCPATLSFFLNNSATCPLNNVTSFEIHLKDTSTSNRE